jgi:hypothetical protein
MPPKCKSRWHIWRAEVKITHETRGCTYGQAMLISQTTVPVRAVRGCRTLCIFACVDLLTAAALQPLRAVECCL